MPDDFLDGHVGYIAAQKEACKAVAKKLASWDKTLRSSEKALAEVQADLDKRIANFKSLQEQLKKVRGDKKRKSVGGKAPKKKKAKATAPPPPPQPSSSESSSSGDEDDEDDSSSSSSGSDDEE